MKQSPRESARCEQPQLAKLAPGLVLAALAVAALPLRASAQDAPEVVDQEQSDALAAQPREFDWYGEDLRFRVNVLLGEIARCALQTGYAGEDDNLGPVVPINGLCTTIGMMAALYNFEYTGFAFMDAETFEPVWGEKVLEDKGRLRSYETYYDREAYTAEVVRREDGRDSPRTRIISERSLDVLSWLQAVRMQDFSIGNSFTHYIFDGWKTRRLRMTVVRYVTFEVGDEGTEVRAAELRVDAQSVGGVPIVPWMRERSGTPPVYYDLEDTNTDVGRAWFSLDENRYPLGVDVDTPFGAMRIRLDALP